MTFLEVAALADVSSSIHWKTDLLALELLSIAAYYSSVDSKKSKEDFRPCGPLSGSL